MVAVVAEPEAKARPYLAPSRLAIASSKLLRLGLPDLEYSKPYT